MGYLFIAKERPNQLCTNCFSVTILARALNYVRDDEAKLVTTAKG